jgi:hypothetical protein
MYEYRGNFSFAVAGGRKLVERFHRLVYSHKNPDWGQEWKKLALILLLFHAEEGEFIHG